MYADKLNGITVAEALELYSLAHFCDVPALVQKCGKLLRDSLIKPEDALTAYETAEKYGECELMDAAKKIMAK